MMPMTQAKPIVALSQRTNVAIAHDFDGMKSGRRDASGLDHPAGRPSPEAR